MRSRASQGVARSLLPLAAECSARPPVIPTARKVHHRTDHRPQTWSPRNAAGVPLHLQVRHASSSSPSFFSLLPRGFFGRSAPSLPKPRAVSEDPIGDVRQALAEMDIPALRVACRSVFDRGKGGSGIQVDTTKGRTDLQALQQVELENLVDAFVSRGHSGDLSMIRDIWQTSNTRSPRLAKSVLSATLEWDTPLAALDFANSIIGDGVSLESNAYDRMLAEVASSGHARGALDFIARTHVSAGEERYTVILHGMTGWELGYEQELDELVSQLDSTDRTPSAQELHLRELVYRRAGAQRKASETALLLVPIAASSLSEGIPVECWNSMLRYESQEKDRWELVQRMEAAGVRPDEETLRTMVELGMLDLWEDARRGEAGAAIESERAIRTVREIERRTGSQADAKAWEIVVSGCLRSENTPGNASTSDQAVFSGLAVYQEMRRDFIAPTLATVTEILHAMSCQARPDEEGMQEIYSELLNAWDETSGLTERERKATSLSLISYVRCLAVGAKKPTVAVTSVLQEMRDRSIKLGVAPKQVADHITFLMRHAPTHHDAFRVYSFVRALDTRALDAVAYEGILSAFVTLTKPRSRIAPPTMFFEFTKDMRGSGVAPTGKVYSILINQYSKALRASRLTGNDLVFARSDALEAIRRAHAYIKLDSFVDLDVPLLNSLMDAYNQVGAFRECFDVWDDLVTRMKYDTNLKEYQPSVSIVLDACGQGRYLKKAKRIWKWATSGAFPVNQNNWAAYIECLSRSDQVMDALEEVRTQATGGGDPRLVVDGEILLILMRFATRRQSTYEQLAMVLEQDFPSIWPRIRSQVVVPWENGSKTG